MKKVVKLSEYRKKKKNKHRGETVRGRATRLSPLQVTCGVFLLAVLVVFVYLLLAGGNP